MKRQDGEFYDMRKEFHHHITLIRLIRLLSEIDLWVSARKKLDSYYDSFVILIELYLIILLGLLSCNRLVSHPQVYNGGEGYLARLAEPTQV